MDVKFVRQYQGHQAAVYSLLPDDEKPGSFFSVGGEGWIAHWHREQEDGKLVGKAENSLFCASQRGKEMAVGGLDGKLYLLGNSEENVRAIEHHRKGIYQLIYADSHLYSLGADGRLTRWALPNYLPEFSIQLSSNALRSYAFTVEGKELWIGASDGNLYRLDLAAGKIPDVIPSHDPSVFAVQYDAFHHRLITGGRDAQIKLWDLENKKIIKTIPAHWYTVNQLLLHPVHPILVSCSRDRTIKLWDMRTMQLMKVIETPKYPGHIRSINSIAWLDEETLLSGGDDRMIMEWRIRV